MKHNSKVSLLTLIATTTIAVVITFSSILSSANSLEIDYLDSWERKLYEIAELKSTGFGYQKLEDGVMLENGDYSIVKNGGSLKIFKYDVEYKDLYQPYNLLEKYNNSIQILNQRMPYYLDTSDGSVNPTIRVIKTSTNTIRVLYIDGSLKSPYFTPQVLSVDDWNKYMEIFRKAGRDDYIGDLETCYRLTNKYNLNLEDQEYMSYIENWDETDYYISRTLNSRQKQLLNDALTFAGYTWEEYRDNYIAIGQRSFSSPAYAVIPFDITLEGDHFSMELAENDLYVTEGLTVNTKKNDSDSVRIYKSTENYLYDWEQDYYKMLNAKLRGKNEITSYLALKVGEYSIIKENSELILYKNGEVIENLSSPFSLKYNDTEIIRNNTYLNTATGSLKPTLRIVQTGENSIKVFYLVGDLPSVYMVPTVLTTWKYKNLIEALQRDKAFEELDLVSGYQYVDDNNRNPLIDERMMELPLWTYKTFYMARILNSRQKQLITVALKKAGYTWDDYKKNYRQTGYKEEKPYIAIVPIEITINEDTVNLKILNNDIYSIIGYKIEPLNLNNVNIE